MISWPIYRECDTLAVEKKLSREIISTIADGYETFFSIPKKRRRPRRTTWIKDKLAILGDKKNYKVYANGLSPELKPLKGGTFKNAQWLYDLHWYTEGKNHYTTRRLPLVMECEWQSERKGDRKKPFSGIKYDFQKLLVTNAEFRVMVFRLVRTRDYLPLTEYFEENIREYKHLIKGSPFLFIAFCDKHKSFFYKEMFK